MDRTITPARPLAGLSGIVLIVVGWRLEIYVLGSPILWTIAYLTAGAGLLYVAVHPSIPASHRAAIAVLVAVSLTARAFALVVALIRVPGLPAPTLVGAMVWPLVALHIVTLLAYWEVLTPSREGGDES